MYATVTTGVFDPERMSQSVAFWKALRKTCQAEAGHLLVDPKTGDWMSLDFWKTELDAERIEKSGQFSKEIETAKEIGIQIMHHRVFEVASQQLGLIAEEVAEVNPDLVRDEEEKRYSVRYDQVNAMLLNEFLKEHRKNEEQGATIARQQKQIEALTAGLQKVSAQLEVSKAESEMVLKNQ